MRYRWDSRNCWDSGGQWRIALWRHLVTLHSALIKCSHNHVEVSNLIGTHVQLWLELMRNKRLMLRNYRRWRLMMLAMLVVLVNLKLVLLHLRLLLDLRRGEMGWQYMRCR